MEQTASDKKSDPAEIYAQARELLAKKDFDAAMEVLDGILEDNAQDAPALALAGDVYAAAGEMPQAIGHYGLAIQAAPGDIAYKRRFIEIAGKSPFTQYNPAIEEILCLCLEAPELECAHAQVLWYTTVRSHPLFMPLLKPIIENIPDPFAGQADLSFLLRPIFLLGVKKIVVCNMEFEEFMTALRRFLLEQAAAPRKKLSPDQYNALLEAVAQYCFNTDYIFNRTEAEEKAVEKLRLELESSAAARQDIVKTGLYACYEPFYKMKVAKDLACLPLEKAQLEDYLDLQERAAKIPSLTEVTNAISLKVRKQYEEFPYPRWRELPPQPPITGPSLNIAGTQILVAGCGTGQEPLSLARSCPRASILAIDLSRTSLAYAARQAEKLGIKNVEFRHADILQLGSLNRTFDCICAGGVLHHMKEPVEGWKVLTGLLKPGGLMRIGLYSAPGRRHVVSAWAAIREGNYTDTAAGMRKFRKDSKELLGDALQNKIFDTGDYYYLSNYRDFLFHVQEHQFTLPQIQKILGDLGLEFLEFFEVPLSEAAQQYCRQHFPDDKKIKTLHDWQKIEEANPDTFQRMYKFWCQKKG
jgi:2-polyprenyl-3-methyl-5-hydroxy-6-metoxy-1,4-benzoquinol methylase